MTTRHQGGTLTEDEFAERFSRSITHLHAYARTISGDVSGAEDVVGETFLNLLASVRRGVGPTADTFDSYVRVSIRHEIINSWRKRRHEFQVDDLVGLSDKAVPVQAPGRAETTWDAEAIRAAFAELPQRSQQVLYLSEVEGRKFSEVATSLGLSESTAYVVAHRAREALRVSYLVHITPEGALCEVLDRAQLAAYVRGRASERKAQVVQEHLDTCEECAETVRRMRGLRLPLGALSLAGLAYPLAEGLGALRGADSAVHSARLADTRVAGTRSRRSRFFSLTFRVCGIAVILFLTGWGIVAAFSSSPGRGVEALAPERSGAGFVGVDSGLDSPGDPAGADSPVEESSSTVFYDGALTAGSPLADAAAPSGAVGSDPLVVSNGDRWGCLVPSSLLAASELPSVAAVWGEPSVEFLMGVPESPVELTVTHPADAGAYRLAVYPDAGVAVDDLPPGCTRGDGAIICTPSAAQRVSGSYTLTFTATALHAHDSRLPRVVVTAA
ncbi:hypothetical protein GCM10022198_09300 [Klugiella xanthotipulae]|uniref:RNA polymerase sigma factor (Sigma-70 family) n=1 Tax=Klugiella xanthotipulae TaxID=244735 RepID=A0A543I660_9MICO|nr:sigma-70 family RNA polymerase sigma factor [Klugiella xanthotipulae]TQM66059.1 RNA polymerase sigma factor (sigma-70 family) [Klugiella xanthotipulae]